MTTIRAYTTIGQSCKLAEILPLDSADMNYWCGTQIRIGGHRTMDKDLDVPCWSLAALLGVLPNENMLVKTTDGEYYCLAKDIMTKHYDNPVDACFKMILKLHELKLL